MQKYEYLLLNIESNKLLDQEKIENTINDLGGQGWELVFPFAHRKATNGQTIWVFKNLEETEEVKTPVAQVTEDTENRKKNIEEEGWEKLF